MAQPARRDALRERLAICKGIAEPRGKRRRAAGHPGILLGTTVDVLSVVHRQRAGLSPSYE
ncbi:hypothetical protein GCM10011492_37690 [Flexivirga endophytica]|uniref:Uncharacterized protein n=1 Tax=Flexivirga endophytica TaxID=1849103 RepID=A0A916X018_9MICO|nr:hypothetical protein GCM10011492_37690 [Flexivirga endophytica]